jgi:hypothetical protein
LVNSVEQPLPVPPHTASFQPRPLDDLVSVVPLTAVTNWEEAGK